MRLARFVWKCSVVFVFFAMFFSPSQVFAQNVTCDISSTPDSIRIGESGQITVTLTNSGPGTVSWIRVWNSDSNMLPIDSVSAGGWSWADEVLSGGSLASGGSLGITVGVTAGSSTGSVSWSAEATDTPGGATVACGGSPTTTLSDQAPASPAISGISLSISATSATVTWTTNYAATSVVEYGTTASYGSTKSDGTLVTSHSSTMDGLSAETTYHYKITSVTGDNVSVNSGDQTFTTGKVNSTTVTQTVTSTVTTTTTQIKIIRDETPPSVKIATELKPTYEESPELKGTATDDKGVSRVEYSVDDGATWSVIDLEDQVGDPKVAFEWTPAMFDDGDYLLSLRATDTSGNKKVTKAVKVTIDRLPPRIGPGLIMFGPQIVGEGDDGFTELLAGVEYRAVFPAVGGPTSIQFSCLDIHTELTKNPDNGYWFTSLTFQKPGTCELYIDAIDGAGNATSLHHMKLRIYEKGKVMDEAGVTISDATVSYYWHNPDERKFVLWGADAYRQQNPIHAQDGMYGTVLPSGKYYMMVDADGKQQFLSDIFTIQNVGLVNQDLTLHSYWGTQQLFGGVSIKFPTWWPSRGVVTPKELAQSHWKTTSFALPKMTLIGEKASTSTLLLRGKPMLISLMTSWHPLTNAQLNALDEIAKQGVAVYPVMVQESRAATMAVQRRGGYVTPFWSDPDGELLLQTQTTGLPTHWLVDRHGQVVTMKTGLIGYQDVIEYISRMQ